MLNVTELIQSGGLLFIAVVIFAETGLLVGFFLPGDTLLLTAGIFVAEGKLPLLPTLLVVMAASIAGNIAGYKIGQKAGPKIFKKKDGVFFRREYIDRAETFYESHGGKTILLARFIPIVRTFAAVVAGMANMPFKFFMSYNIAGGILWGGSVTLLGYWFGARIPNIDHYILPTILLATVASLGPSAYHLGKNYLEQRKN